MKFFSFDCSFFSFFSFKKGQSFSWEIKLHFSSLQIPSPLAIDFLRECVCDTTRRRRSINEKKESTPAARGEREDGFEVRF